MRLTSIALVAGLAGMAALSTPASAGGYGVAYFGLRGSYAVTDTTDVQSTNIDYDQSYEDGYAASAFVGWVLDKNFRLELEAAYRSADLDSVYITRNLIVPATEDNGYSASGDVQAGAMMVNLYYDLHLPKIGVLPWIGAGLGGSYIDYKVSEPNSTLSAKDNTWVFSYQLMAGVTVPVSEGVSMSAAYRWFQTSQFDIVDNFGETFETDLTQNSIDLGIQFHL